MEIKIVKGTYGRRIVSPQTGAVRVHPVSMGERVEVSDQEAARLVALGIAAYAGMSTEAPPVAPVPPSGGDEPEGGNKDTSGEDAPAEALTEGEEGDADASEVKRLERMSKDDLVQMAQDMGIDISGAKNNHERAVLIAAANEVEDGDAPPDLGAGDIVQ